MARLLRPRGSVRRLSLLGALSLLIAAALIAVLVLRSSSSSSPLVLPKEHPGPESIFEAEPEMHADAAGTLDLLRRLGVDRLRLYLPWNAIAPDPTAASPPPGFDASDPAAYPQANWATYDTIMRDARVRGIGVDLTVGDPAPEWATGLDAPRSPFPGVWKPSDADFAAFMRAVGTRYSGTYKPPGATQPLPRVDFWAIWNEPNYGVDLAPQAVDDSTVEVSPRLYRGLLNAAWRALARTGHAHDTILIGELAPRGITVGDQPGNFSGMVPLRFIRALYCVGADYRPLTGTAALRRGCPATAAGSARFAAANPLLFHASGFSDHPYPMALAPNVGTPIEPDYADFAALPKLERVLDTVQRVYGSSTRLAIYSTEFGYKTDPPQPAQLSPATAADYLNWAEYLTWRDPRLRSFDQYQLQDGAGSVFATGLEFAGGKPKATFFAYRMPVYLPVTTSTAGNALEVWGCVRPAPDAGRTTGRPQRVAIQYRTGAGPFRTLRLVTITNSHGYFDVSQPFSAGGTLRLSWSYPGGGTIHSRLVKVTIK